MDTLRIVEATVEPTVKATVKATVPLPADGSFQHEGTPEDIEQNYLDRRDAVRAPVQCPVSFISEERCDDWSTREGRLLDLSKTGCRIASQHAPEPGSQITLILPLPDGMPPIRLIGTTVCYVHWNEFGAKFQPLTPQERRRVQAIVFKHVTWSPHALRRPAFLIL
ncbi:MAG TPA: PilZ domain-containing protein [Nitrospira sp.]|jgi:c-di-GMP-binding flagellar brake protein YcgR|nr:PilZ domain-containing protein [Nitrospira sp.]